jgi:FlaA1/EpsC-like NDP-sugar epimerase
MYNAVSEMSKIPSGSRVIFYGAGRVGKECAKEYNQGQPFSLLFFVDQRCTEIGSVNGFAVKSPDVLLSSDFDYVLITTESYYTEVLDTIENMGVSCDKVVSCLHFA